jgi:anthranilate synthase component II
MRVFIIDNYDSFTYNLYQYIGEILQSRESKGTISSFEIAVKRNNQTTIEEIKEFNPDRIIISPGPGNPEDEAYFGVSARAITELGPKIPLLGVCLGMQGIVHYFGGKVIKAALPMHGKTSAIRHNNCGIFKNIPNNLEIMRYHSLVGEPATFPSCLTVTAAVGELDPIHFENNQKVRSTKNYEIMGIQHKEFPIYGIQFHPESFATEGGRDIINNFLFPETSL